MDQEKPEKENVSRDKLFADLSESSERLKQYEKERKKHFKEIYYFKETVAVILFIAPFLHDFGMTFTFTSWFIGGALSILIFTSRSHKD